MRNKFSVLVIIFFVCLSNLSLGQKVKYKDLFFLLQKSKKYEEGEPFLRSFLANPKNDDHPNAHFQMGVIYELNADKKDVLKENDDKAALLDSAIYFYSKAKTLISEKEVKRNSEYYEDDFLRRDLRTGKMGIKMSDVHLDIDKRIENIKTHSTNLKIIADHFHKSVAQYNTAYEQYTNLVSNFDSQRTFYLRATDEVLKTCEEIEMSYDSAMGNFGEYEIKIAEIEDSNYDQTLQVMEIKDIKKDGEIKADFYTKSVEVYNFDKWANEVKSIIVDELRPVIQKIISQDGALDNMYKQVLKDSVSVINKLELTVNDEIGDLLGKYDKNPMPLSLLNLKQEEIKYWSHVFENKPLKDTSNVRLQLSMAQTELANVIKVDSIVNHLLGYNLAVEVENYAEYVNKQYEGTAGLERFIRQKLNFAQAEKKYRATILAAKQERSRWLFYGNDSIPLFKRDTTQQLLHKDVVQYVMFGKDTVDANQSFTYGMKYDTKDQGFAYVTSITDSLITPMVSTYQMKDAVFGMDKLNFISHQTVKDEALKLTYVLYYDNSPFEQVDKKAQLTCISVNGKVLWSKSIALVYPPQNMVLYDKGGVSINYDVKYIDTENSAKLVSRLIVGSDGKVIN